MSPIRMQSPDARLKAEFRIQSIGEKNDCLTYRIQYADKWILGWSGMGFALKGVPDLEDGFELVQVSESKHDSVWQPVAGENRSIRDHYRQYIIQVKEKSKLHRILSITFRLYDGGVAFQYTFQRTAGFKRLVMEKELTRFAFLDNHSLYATYHAQGAYERTTLLEMKPGCERPLVLEVKDGPYIALAEAKLVDYARMKLTREDGYTLRSDLTGKPLFSFQEEEHLKAIAEERLAKVTAETPFTTPWRVVMAADSPGELYEGNELLLNLNDPCAIADPSFIYPGKVIREATLTTEGGIACVDFAVRHKLQYIEFDAGWYGPEDDFASDATQVSIDPRRYIGPLDLHRVIRYAKDNGIKVMLYINHRAMVNQLDELLPLYKMWGVEGIKFGFVEVGPQRWTSWLHECVRKAADYGFVLTIHDEYRPTGYQRTYPNLLTQEGIRGDEERQPAENTLITVFTRMLAGPGDHTVCYYDQRVDELWSHAYQLAKSVVLFSPLQFLYWYDRPMGSIGAAADALKYNVIGEEPELEFFDRLPTTWDETKVLNGEIGSYVTMARRKGEQWFICIMNAKEKRRFEIPLDFLDEGVYAAHIYADDSSLDTRTRVKREKRTLTSRHTFRCEIEADNGCAIRFEPIANLERDSEARSHPE